jgi:hypothetical protein
MDENRTMHPFRRKFGGTTGMVCLLVAWSLSVVLGTATMVKYASTPGRIATPPLNWPHNTEIQPASPKATLLVFVHPQCPCSRATLEELAEIMVLRPQVEGRVYFLEPAGVQWSKSDLYESASRIPGVRVFGDPNGAIAQQFGARTSGQSLLYDAAGRLVFNGGITAARGHAGANDGQDAVMALLRGGSPRHRTTPVFGCALYGDE